jgi:filamentous hemagglutinin
MNKNCYRIIFSKAKNMFIAVAENIKSQTKTAGQSTNLNRAEKSDHTPFHQTWQVKGLVASMSLFTSLAPVYAQIQVAPNAQASQKASIGVGRNQQGQNVPVVDIQTPKNGVSHNVYNQFDVLQPGVVLNNSRNGAGSVIVGNVGANPYLQIGEARVILNEVNSSAASQFKGNLEVAGQRADVIIANPSGINIQGGGFINANKAIFTTGKIQLNPDGSIQQFVVDQGKVNVSSTGNNLGLGGINNNADYVDIYAKAVELNAQVHANQTLQVITGSNTVSNDLSTITPNQVNSTTPTFALDVKALGGMYANNIFIIGTDKGLGVRNAGTIQSPQTLVITSAGKIENTGTLKNTNPQGSLLSISTGEGADIVSSGSMISNGNLLLESGRNITFDRARLEKNGVDNPNIISVSAKGDVNFKNSSNVQNFGQGGNLYIDAKNINLDSNMNIGVNGSIQLVADNNIRIQDSGNFSSVNDIYIQAKNDLNIENSKISANQGDINLTSNGTLNGKNIDINSKQGTLSIQSKLDLNLVPKKEITYDKRAPDIAVETYTKNVLTGLNGVNLVSSDLGKISLENTNINAKNGDIQIYGGNGIDLKEQFSSALVEVEFWGRKVLWPFPTKDYSKISSKGLYLKSNKDLNMNYISINTIGGGINVEALGWANLLNSNLKSEKNIEIISNDINSRGLDVNSGQNIALQSKDLTVTERSKYNANGMVSLVSEGGGGNGLIDSEVSSKGFYLKSNTGRIQT